MDDPVSVSSAPRVWLLLTDKRGDNAQVEALGAAVKLPVVRRALGFRPPFDTAKPQVVPSLHHLDRDRCDPLEPPWPDVVIAAGRRPALVALWLKAQSKGYTQVVMVGRPWGPLAAIDLAVVPAHYRVARRPNVVFTAWPLGAVPRGLGEEQDTAADPWRAWPRPLTAVLVGGPTGSHALGVAALATLERQLLAATAGVGSVYITTSRRTPPAVARVAGNHLSLPGEVYRFGDEAKANPYGALLTFADRFVVTGDSVSMALDVARRGRPLAIFPLPFKTPWSALRSAAVAHLRPRGRRAGYNALGAGLQRLNLLGPVRDFDAFHRDLYHRGLAVPLVQGFSAPTDPTTVSPGDEAFQVADRVRDLVASRRRSIPP